MSALAMFGGPKSVTSDLTVRDHIGWPIVTDAEYAAVREVFETGRYASNDAGKGEVSALERAFRDYTGAAHCAAVSNGTAALALALAAFDFEPGDEVLVPALSFIATAIAPVQRMLVPVFVDIDPRTYNMDPTRVEAAITSRTRAIVVVHLHGLPADLAELRAIADRHGLRLIEDAAQAQGATYQGRKIASPHGDIATVSLNVVKNLPTCGEGGLVTTNDEALHERVVLGRQFGEDLRAGAERDYVSRFLAGNEKMSAVQAGFARAQLARLDEYATGRERNVTRFLARLRELPGVVVPFVPADRTHAWHILRLRFDPAALGLDIAAGPFRHAVHRALRAEGVPVQPYQIVPLPGQLALRNKAGFGGYPWSVPGARDVDYRIEDYPETCALIDESLTLQRWHLNPNAGPVLDAFADGFEKVWTNLEEIMPMARGRTHRAPWDRLLAVSA